MRDDLKLLLSCYACEPNRGSEPGVGWAWALGMAKRHETWILTRANNRSAIEIELDRLGIPEPERPRFVYVDLPKWLRCLKKSRVVPVSLYYLLWQFAARRAWDRSGVRVDVIHHVTFNSFVVPGVWWRREEKVVLGPLGGMSVCPRQYLRCFPGSARFREAIRGFTRRLWKLDRFFVRSRAFADVVVYTTREMFQTMDDGRGRARVLLETAVPDALIRRPPPVVRQGSASRRFVWAGTLAGHKAGEIAIRAFVRAFGTSAEPPVLDMFGSGPDESNWKTLSRNLHADSFIRFRGSVSQAELWKEMSEATALFFTSVRDTSGNVVLEALACGTPVVCFKHQGVAEIVDDTCSIMIEPTGWDETVDLFARALRRLDADSVFRNKLATEARNRAVSCFQWDAKFNEFDRIYYRLVHH